ncbi:MAG: BLUF domain-containing protein [Solirubrobacterales bacterium]
MRCLVYLSHERRAMTRSDLHDILRASRIKNTVAGVTGVLVYDQGTFIQVLEGDAHAVGALFETIRGDRRHAGVEVLLDVETDRRTFSEWSMAFIEADSLPPNERWLTRSLSTPLPALGAGAVADRVRALMAEWPAHLSAA